ncbi:alginate export family protein [Zymomonas mobilis]|nr:alginate export family protein [Zymomonas mobilis]
MLPALSIFINQAAKANSAVTAKPEEEEIKQNLVTKMPRTENKAEILAPLPSLPPIENFPHANPVGQPYYVPQAVNRRLGHQCDWGVFNRGDGEAAGFGPVGRYGVAAWAEDWSALSDPKNRKDPFDFLKYRPLNKSGSLWISFSGETRFRNWFETKPQLGAQKIDNSGRFGIRNLYGADLHVGSHLRFFAQIVNGDASGWNVYGYGSTYRKSLDLQQAFVEIKGPVLGAKSGLIIGRQQFLDAPSYMLYNRETPNVPLSWNGFRGYSIWSRIRIDGWYFVGTNTDHNAIFHDNQDYATRLYGFNTTWAPPDFSFFRKKGYSFLDAFYIGYRLVGSSGAISAPNHKTSQGTDLRNNFGIRWHGAAGAVEFSLGAIWQGGCFRYAGTDRNRNISAYAINSIVGYRFPKNSLRLFAGIQTDVYSGGNASKTSGTIGGYITPFNPQTNYLDTTTYIAPSNLISVAPLVRLTPLKSVSLQIKAPLFWRENTDDPIYKSSGIYSFAYNFDGKFIGTAPQAALTWQINTHISWTQYVSRFVTSHALHQAGASSGTYYQSNFVFRF